jgi:hypothetical protein
VNRAPDELLVTGPNGVRALHTPDGGFGLTPSYQVSQEPRNQRTYHADDFVLAHVVVVITH